MKEMVTGWLETSIKTSGDSKVLKWTLMRFPVMVGSTMTGPSGMLTIKLSLLKVRNKIMDFSKFQMIIGNISVGEVLQYPKVVTISSTGRTSERWPGVLGVYNMITRTFEGRPVWQITGREDRYLFYNGTNNPTPHKNLTCSEVGSHVGL